MSLFGTKMTTQYLVGGHCMKRAGLPETKQRLMRFEAPRLLVQGFQSVFSMANYRTWHGSAKFVSHHERMSNCSVAKISQSDRLEAKSLLLGQEFGDRPVSLLQPWRMLPSRLEGLVVAL
jgi:hypothetical protein